MEIITKEKFEEAAQLKPVLNVDATAGEMTEEKFEQLMKDMQNPVNFQKEIAVKIKYSLDLQIKLDLEKQGVLSDHTRRWVETYNKILEKIQSAIHGDKSVNLHIHKVSHGDIAARLRELK
jgi:hypothetical protein